MHNKLKGMCLSLKIQDLVPTWLAYNTFWMKCHMVEMDDLGQAYSDLIQMWPVS